MDVINEALCICCAGGLVVAMAAYAIAMIFFPSTSGYSQRDVEREIKSDLTGLEHQEPPPGAKDWDSGAGY